VFPMQGFSANGWAGCSRYACAPSEHVQKEVDDKANKASH
jgi:hypothetical protein